MGSRGMEEGSSCSRTKGNHEIRGIQADAREKEKEERKKGPTWDPHGCAIGSDLTLEETVARASFNFPTPFSTRPHLS